ncbi:hypothetical protein ACH5RR_026251 [Cinchona calisaya]|uniref:Uncharacterized protein n=1 Tax=Cinchona calisaya TaxID=153742 RepID=A0ABD2Z480_9GENT
MRVGDAIPRAVGEETEGLLGKGEKLVAGEKGWRGNGEGKELNSSSCNRGLGKERKETTEKDKAYNGSRVVGLGVANNGGR